jgi:hypothetical protein
MDTSNKNEKPKTIATIDVNIQWPKIESRDWIEESVNDHNNCVLCGTPLTFKHHTNFADHTVAEDANCQGCRIRSRQTVHTLQ